MTLGAVFLEPEDTSIMTECAVNYTWTLRRERMLKTQIGDVCTRQWLRKRKRLQSNSPNWQNQQMCNAFKNHRVSLTFGFLNFWIFEFFILWIFEFLNFLIFDIFDFFDFFDFWKFFWYFWYFLIFLIFLIFWFFRFLRLVKKNCWFFVFLWIFWFFDFFDHFFGKNEKIKN